MRRTTLACVLLATCLWGGILPADDAADRQRDLANQLATKKVTLEVEAARLDKTLMTVARLTRVSIVLDPDAWAKDRPAGECLVSVAAEGLPLGDFLARVLEPLGLQSGIRDGVILVTNNKRLIVHPGGATRDDTPKAVRDVRLNFEMESKPLHEVTDAVARLARVTVRYDSPLSAPEGLVNVTGALYDLPAEYWLNLAGLFTDRSRVVEDGTVMFLDSVGRGNRAILQRLREQRISRRFDATPLTEAFNVLQTLGEVNIVQDVHALRKEEPTITVAADEQPFLTVLEACLKQAGLAYRMRNGVAFVTTADRLAVLDAEALETARQLEKRAAVGHRPSQRDTRTQTKLDETIVSFTFTEQPLYEALEFLQTLGNVNIMIDRGKVKPNASVTLRLVNIRLASALTLLVEQLDLRWTVRDGIVFVSDPATVRGAAWLRHQVLGPKPTEDDRTVFRKTQETIVSFTFNEQPFREALEFLSTLGNVNIVLDSARVGLRRRPVTLKLTNRPLKAALELVAEQVGLDFIIQDGIVFVSTPKQIAWRHANPERFIMPENPTEAQRRAYEALARKHVSFTFNDQPVKEALDFLQTLNDVGVVLDTGKVHEDLRLVTLKLHNVPLKTAWVLLAEQLDLRAGIRDGAVVVGTEEDFGKENTP